MAVVLAGPAEDKTYYLGLLLHCILNQSLRSKAKLAYTLFEDYLLINIRCLMAHSPCKIIFA